MTTLYKNLMNLVGQKPSKKFERTGFATSSDLQKLRSNLLNVLRNDVQGNARLTSRVNNIGYLQFSKFNEIRDQLRDEYKKDVTYVRAKVRVEHEIQNNIGVWYRYEELHNVDVKIRGDVDNFNLWEAVEDSLLRKQKNPDYHTFSIMEIISHTTVSGLRLNTARKPITQVPMHCATPLEYHNIPADFSYEKHANECVYDAILGRYCGHIKRLNKERLMSIFNATDSQDGVTIEQVLVFCEKYDITMYAFDLRSKMVAKNISRNRHYPPLCYYIGNNHMYLITDQDFLTKVANTRSWYGNKTNTTDLLQPEQIPIVNNARILIDEDYTEHSGKTIIYDQEDLYYLALSIYSQDRFVPKAFFEGDKVTMIEYKSNILHANPNASIKLHPEKIMKACENLGIAFKNQSIGRLVRQMYQLFYDTKRQKISDAIREEIRNKQHNKCAKCDSEPEQLDHIKALANGGTNEKENLQYLCKACHQQKTENEREQGYIHIDSTSSSFNGHTFDMVIGDGFRRWAFVEWYEDKVSKDLNSIDLNKCRKNIMLNSEYDYCVYTVMDMPEKFDGQIRTGFYYVETDQYFPMRGTRWYSEPMIRYALEEGLISKNDIKAQFIPGLTVAHDHYNSFIEHMYEKLDKDVAKLCINALIGTFNKSRVTRTTGHFSESFDDIAYFYMDNKDNDVHVSEEDGLYILKETKTITPDSNNIPMYAQILDIEAIELHKMTKMIKENNGQVVALSTDAVIYRGSQFEIDTHKYKYEKKSFRICNRLKGETGDYKYEIPEHVYNELASDTLPEAIVDLKKGCTIQGKAGTGKTTLTKKIIKVFQQHKIPYKVLAPTNKACRNFENATTIHKFAQTYFSNPMLMYQIAKNYKYIIVDEISMVPEIFYKMLLFCKRLGCKIIMVGDFAQLPVVCDRIDCDYESSRVLWEIVDGNRLILTKCRRASADGIKLFEMCEDIDSADVSGLRDGRTSFVNICYTHERRKKINKTCMEQFTKGKKCIKIDKRKGDSKSQDVVLCKETPIISRVTCSSSDIAKNETFKITKVTKKIITIKNERNTLEIPVEKFQAMFYVAFAITGHASQGTTIDEHYCIHEWNSHVAGPEWRYVTITRCTKLKNVTIA